MREINHLRRSKLVKAGKGILANWFIRAEGVQLAAHKPPFPTSGPPFCHPPTKLGGNSRKQPEIGGNTGFFTERQPPARRLFPLGFFCPHPVPFLDSSVPGFLIAVFHDFKELRHPSM